MWAALQMVAVYALMQMILAGVPFKQMGVSERRNQQDCIAYVHSL